MAAGTVPDKAGEHTAVVPSLQESDSQVAAAQVESAKYCRSLVPHQLSSDQGQITADPGKPAQHKPVVQQPAKLKF
jgi:hypothetical protein